MSEKRLPKVVNCALCGRDTQSRSGVCSRCYSGLPISELRGRKVISPRCRSAIDDVECDEDDPIDATSERYHGDTIRDDI